VLAAGAAVFLAASLILEAAVRQVTLGRWFAVAGLAFLVLAILFPSRPRRRRVDGHSRAQAPTCENADDGSDNPRSATRDE
jgi:hypothetical protein